MWSMKMRVTNFKKCVDRKVWIKWKTWQWCYLPVNTLAWLFPKLNCVSRYFGRNTTNPDTIMSSMQAPRHVTTYTELHTSRHIERGMSAQVTQIHHITAHFKWLLMALTTRRWLSFWTFDKNIVSETEYVRIIKCNERSIWIRRFQDWKIFKTCNTRCLLQSKSEKLFLIQIVLKIHTDKLHRLTWVNTHMYKEAKTLYKL